MVSSQCSQCGDVFMAIVPQSICPLCQASWQAKDTGSNHIWCDDLIDIDDFEEDFVEERLY